jgi:hypothetical protein
VEGPGLLLPPLPPPLPGPAQQLSLLVQASPGLAPLLAPPAHGESIALPLQAAPRPVLPPPPLFQPVPLPGPRSLLLPGQDGLAGHGWGLSITTLLANVAKKQPPWRPWNAGWGLT